MKKRIQKIICAFLCISLMPIISFASAYDAGLILNSSFNAYTTYSLPEDLVINSKLAWVDEYKAGDKGLILSGEKSSSSLTYDVSLSSKFCFSFDVKCASGCPAGVLYVKSSGGKKQAIVSFDGTKRLKAFNGRHIGGYSIGNISNVAFALNPADGTIDYYFNGKLKLDNCKINAYAINPISEISFEFSHEGKSAILLDNINLSVGSLPLSEYPVDDYNPDSDEKISVETMNFAPVYGENVMLNADFETMPAIGLTGKSNTLETIKDPFDENNTVLLAERTPIGGSDFHADANNLYPDADYVVYEFEFKNMDSYSVFTSNLKDDNDESQTLFALGKDSTFKAGSTIKTLQLQKWYKAAAVLNYFDREISYYLDGKLLSTEPFSSSAFAVGSKPGSMRIHMTKYVTIGGTITEKDPINLHFDNWRVYEGTEPREDVGPVSRTIKLTNKTIFPKYTSIKNSLEGYVTLHTRSGVVYKDGVKRIMYDAPHMENRVFMVNTAELSKLLGVANPYTQKYVQAEKYFTEGLGKKIYKDTSCLNYGMIIAGDYAYKAPSDSDSLQELNDFLWHLHPTSDIIKEMYAASELKGVHPRIHATADDFARLREEIKTNTQKEIWAHGVIAAADNLATKPALIYELRDGVRLLGVSRDMLSRMYACGMAYQLTGEQKYADIGWRELEAVCSFNDWHPSHALDTGEMASAVAVGYDWLYHGLSEQQRAFVEDGFYRNAFYDYNILYTTSKGAMSILGVQDSNWVCAINGGAIMAAIAMMDVYPEVSEKILGCAVTTYSQILYRFAPEGAWYEGAGYWEYVFQYTAKAIDCLNNVFGTAMGLDGAQGMSTAAEFEVYSQSPIGVYAYGDTIRNIKTWVPEMIWLVDYYGKKELVPFMVDRAQMTDSEDMALSLLWTDVNYTTGDTNVGFSLDKYYESMATITLRDCWDKKEQTFVGIHAGPTSTDHHHLDGGSFVFESMGVQWAIDPGNQGYNKEGYWDVAEGGGRWKVFANRAEAHNTVVINPGLLEDHKVYSDAPITKYESKPKGTVTLIDMTDLHFDVLSHRRGFAFVDNRKSLVIRDELNLKPNSTAYWHMMTEADVSIEGNSAILYQDGRKLKLEFDSSVPAEFTVAPAAPLPSSPVHPQDGKLKMNRIQIKVSGSGNANITVKLTPYDVDGSPLSDWNKSIDLWQIPDGEIPLAPKLDSIKVGEDLIIPQGSTIDYYYLEDTFTSVPDITASDDRYNITVAKGNSLSDNTVITVVDKNDPANKTIYTIVMRKIPTPKQFDGKTSIPVTTLAASAEPQAENGAMNVIDGDLNTRWSCDESGCTLTLDLNKVQRVDEVALAFAGGDTRATRFEIAVSADGETYESVFSGQSSGTTLEHEFYGVGGKDIRYIKLNFNGNTSKNSPAWNSVTEVVVTRNN